MSFIDKFIDAIKLNDDIDDDDDYIDDADDFDDEDEDEVPAREKRRAFGKKKEDDEEDEDDLDDVSAREKKIRKAGTSAGKSSRVREDFPDEDSEEEREREKRRGAERAKERERERERARRERERREREREREAEEREAREREAEMRARRSKVTPIRGKKGNTPVSMSVNVVHVTKFDDSQAIANGILAGDTIIINLEGLDNETAQRAIDFVSGACYAVDGHLSGISGSILIAAPAGVDISGTYEEILNGSSNAPDLEAQYM